MIEISISKENKKISFFEITGHASFSNYGNDIVCAGVSAIVFGILNSLDKNPTNKILVRDKSITIKVSDLKDEKTQIILETLKISLLTMMESYPKNIKLEENKNEIKI